LYKIHDFVFDVKDKNIFIHFFFRSKIYSMKPVCLILAYKKPLYNMHRLILKKPTTPYT